jgi:signal transduction histidine kinase
LQILKRSGTKTSRQIFLITVTFLVLACGFSCQKKNKEKEHPEYFDAVIKQAQGLIESGHPEKGLIYLDSSYKAFSSAGNYDLFRKYNLETNYYMVIAQDLKKASLCADSMIDMLKDDPESHREDYTYSLNTKGLILFNQLKFNEAFGYIYSALSIAKKYSETCAYASFSSSLGLILFRQQKYQDALVYFQSAYNESGQCNPADRIKSFDLRQGYLDNIALCYERVGKLDSAVVYYRKALKFIEQNESRFTASKSSIESQKAIIYGNLGGTLYNLGQMEEAEKLLTEGVRINRQKGHENRDAHYTGIKLANLYITAGRFDEAWRVMTEVRSSLDSLPVEEAELRWRKLAWRYYDTLGQTAKAYSSYKFYTAFKDSFEAKRKEFAGADVNKAFESLSQQYQIALLTADNKWKTVFLAVAVLVAMMALVIIYLILRNFSQTKRNVKQLEDLNAKVYEQNARLQHTLTALQQSQEDNTKMMRVVVHDLRNPIAAIISLSEIMLESNRNSKEQVEMLQMIKESGSSALMFVGDILEANTKADEIEKEKIDLCEVISDSVALMSVRAKDKNQRVWLHAESVPVMANREKIWRVINNLIFNAIKFSPEDSRIDVSLKKKDNVAQFSVKDHGIGIPPEIKDKIFDAFSMAKRAGTSGEQSFGLGLAISRQIIEAHGGKIAFDTESGKGTTFHVELPLVEG